MCVSVVLVIKHAKRTRCIMLSSVVSLGLPHFSALSHKGSSFPEKKLINMKFDFLYNFV